jgi:hypothetical protein
MPNCASSWLTSPSPGEHLAPQHRDRDARAEQRGQIEHRAIERQAADAAVEDHRDREREHELERHRRAPT